MGVDQARYAWSNAWYNGIMLRDWAERTAAAWLASAHLLHWRHLRIGFIDLVQVSHQVVSAKGRLGPAGSLDGCLSSPAWRAHCEAHTCTEWPADVHLHTLRMCLHRLTYAPLMKHLGLSVLRLFMKP